MRRLFASVSLAALAAVGATGGFAAAAQAEPTIEYVYPSPTLDGDDNNFPRFPDFVAWVNADDTDEATNVLVGAAATADTVSADTQLAREPSEPDD